MRPLVKHHNALLMANHGAVAYGSDLWQAFDRLETLEHTARIAILSRMLGGAISLPAAAIEKLINVREVAGYLDEGARCQACGYLHQTQLACPSGDRPPPADVITSAPNGAGKISLTREELVELLTQAVSSK
jgi:L-fuculose-phosphate aldolase